MSTEDRDRIVSMTTFNVMRENFAQVSREAQSALEDRARFIEGFLDGWLLINEERSRIVFFSEWKSRHSWALAQWDEDIARALADMFERTASYSLEFFYPLAHTTAQ